METRDLLWNGKVRILFAWSSTAENLKGEIPENHETDVTLSDDCFGDVTVSILWPALRHVCSMKCPL